MTLITVDKHTDAWVAALLAGFDLILFGVDGRLVLIDFDSDLTLITVDTHTGAWVAALRAGFDLILFGFDAVAWWWMLHCCRM